MSDPRHTDDSLVGMLLAAVLALVIFGGAAATFVYLMVGAAS